MNPRSPHRAQFPKLFSIFCAVVLTSSACTRAVAEASEPFLVKPYLQLGYEKRQPNDNGTYSLVWFVSHSDASGNAKKSGPYAVKVKSASDKAARPAKSISERKIVVPGGGKSSTRYTAVLDGLKAGEAFTYSVEHNGAVLFSSGGKMLPAPEKKTRIAIFGDTGALTPGQRLIAAQCNKAQPDVVVIPGDVVYQRGFYSEYLTNFFPVFNHDPIDKNDTSGVPLMRSTPFATVLGNHDIALSGRGTDLDRFPETLAFFYFWQSPLNGPDTAGGALPDISLVKNGPALKGDPQKEKQFMQSAGDSFPTMANYSFDCGNSHWTVIDGNFHTDWTDEKLRAWLEADLKAVKPGMWKFVTMHQPTFSVDAPHGKEQRTRVILDILQKNGVNMVLAGHSHCYERTKPIIFNPPAGATKFAYASDKLGVPGEIIIDHEYDGVKKTRPAGIIHIVTGAGGAPLYMKDISYNPPKDKDFMVKFESGTHSLTIMDLQGNTCKIKQIAGDGRVIDEFTVTK